MKRLQDALASRSVDMTRLLFTAFFEQGMEACLLTRTDGSILAGNEEALRLFGYSNEELRALGRSAITLGDDARLAELLARRGATGKARGRLAMRKKNGERFEAEISSTVFVLGEAGECATIVVRDLTDILRAEAMKRASDERLGFTLDAAHIGHWDVDITTGEGFRSRTLFAHFGLDAEPAGWCVERFLQYVHADDRARVANAYRAAVTDGTLYDEEFRILWPDGSLHWLWARGRVSFDAAGRPRRMLGIQIDISERQQALLALRESETRFRTVADAAPVMIFMIDAERRRTFSNRTWLEFTGRNPGSAEGLGWQDLLHPDDLRRVWDEFAGVFAQRLPYRTEYRMRNAGGEYRWIFVEARPRFDGAGLFLGYIGICVDITALKEAESAQRALEAQLREAQKMEAVGTMAGGIAHDFNNIVGTILGNAELAREDLPGDSGALQSLDEIVKAGQRARDLVSQILSFSRRQPTSLRVLSLPERAAGVLALLRSTLLAQTTLEYREADDVPKVNADPVQVDQVLINLVTNAAQAMQGRAGRIEIVLDSTIIDAALPESTPGLPPGRYARVLVQDDGPGMDDKTLDRIFEPFFTTKPVGQGTGLGLAVVYGIMRAHGGKVVAESSPGAGTSFHLYFPESTAEPDREARPDRASARVEGRSRRVLYIDDDESLAFLVKRLLERQGFSVTSALGPEDGLDRLRADPSSFDLLVTDYNMARLNGLDVAREAMRLRPDLPVAIASGFITDDMRRRAAELGIRDLIFKPNVVEEYCEVVNRLASRAVDSA